MKHVWQSIVNEHHGTLQIFVSDRGTGKRTDIVLICLKPLCISFNKSISFRDIINPIDLGEEYPQLFTGFSFRRGPEPPHPFPLNMIQTSLECRSWPNQPDGSGNRLFTIGSDESRIQSLRLKSAKPRIGLQKGLLLNIHVGDNLLIYPIHKIQQAAVLVKVGCIVKHILYLGIIDLFVGYLFEPVILNAIKCKSAIARKLLKSPDRIALSNPQFEPVLAAVDTVIPLFPDKCALTL
jgi:hypothetical protein